MRILSSFTDFYDGSAARVDALITYRRKDLFTEESRLFNSELEFPDATGQIQRRYNLEYSYVLLAGMLWPIITAPGLAPRPARLLRPEPLLDIQGWETSRLDAISSSVADQLQQSIGHPVARIAPDSPGRVRVYKDVPHLQSLGFDRAEIPARIALWIAAFLRRCPQATNPERKAPIPTRPRIL